MPKIESNNYGHDVAMKARHADLEARIAQETARPLPDANIIARLKRQKLRIKDSLGFAS